MLLPFLKRVLVLVVGLFREFSLFLIRAVCKHARVMLEGKRSDDAIIRSWLSICGHMLPHQKNLIGKALNIVANFRRDQGIRSVS